MILKYAPARSYADSTHTMKMKAGVITIIGGGLAGCEAAYQAARHGVEAVLYEMKPSNYSAAHKLETLAELVCSNSLKSKSLDSAAGVLKEEMRLLGSLTMMAAEETHVPAGKALAVDRVRFSRYVTNTLERAGVRIVRRELTSVPGTRPLIIATGPLTSDGMAAEISRLVGDRRLSFFDAISPILYKDSIDFKVAFMGSRYGHGDDYINCPMSECEYNRFVDELLMAEKVVPRGFEDTGCFEGCMPVEVMAERGRDTLAYGPMRPVGFIDPRTGKRPYAVVQLRRENMEDTIYNMVGFQTRMTYPEQKRILRLISGLERAVFARLGSVHRNTYIDSPRLLDCDLRMRRGDGIFFAGQITGVEGYCESAATGIIAGINAVRRLYGLPTVAPPRNTIIGGLLTYISDPALAEFQPMNANLGILGPLEARTGRAARRRALCSRALDDMRLWIQRAIDPMGGDAMACQSV